MNQPPAEQIRCKSDQAFLEQGGYWDQSQGDRVRSYISQYCVDDKGQPFNLLPWQALVIDSWYCWRQAGGLPRVKTGWLTVARQNGKTQLIKALCSYSLMAAGYDRPSVVCCACDKSQADIITERFRWDIEHREELRDALHVTKKEILYAKKGGRFRSHSKEHKSALGGSHHVTVFDELAFQTDKLWISLSDSGKAKADSVRFVISTAGWDQNGIFYRQYQHAKSILSGEIIDPSFVPWIFEVPEVDQVDLDSPDVWRLANPSLGVLFSEQAFRDEWARHKGHVADRLKFLRLNFNSWTQGRDGWLSAERWDSSKGAMPDLRGAPVYVGIDAGLVSDMTGIVAVFPVDGRYYVKSWGLVPQRAADDRRKRQLQPYEPFTSDGSLRIVAGDEVSIEADIYPLLDRLIVEHDVRGIITDQWQLKQLEQHYLGRRVTVFRFPQNHRRFTDPCRGLERALNEGKICHDGNSLLRWQVGHVGLDRDRAGYIKPAKPHDAAKIDCVVALVMAFEQAALAGSHVSTPPEIFIF